MTVKNEPWLHLTTHECARCEAPLYYNGERWVDAWQDGTFDVCELSDEGEMIQHKPGDKSSAGEWG